jgi:hypothetical protein
MRNCAGPLSQYDAARTPEILAHRFRHVQYDTRERARQFQRGTHPGTIHAKATPIW